MNSLTKYNQNFITKIRNLFKAIFKKNNEKIINKNDLINNNEYVNNKKENTILSDLKVYEIGENKEVEKEIFIKNIEENPELLEKLSTDRLKKIDEYYDKIIEKNNSIIKKLRNQN